MTGALTEGLVTDHVTRIFDDLKVAELHVNRVNDPQLTRAFLAMHERLGRGFIALATAAGLNPATIHPSGGAKPLPSSPVA